MIRQSDTAHHATPAPSLETLDPTIADYLWSSPIATILSSPGDGLIYDANPAFCELSGYTREALIGQHFADLQLWAGGEDHSRVTSAAGRSGNSESIEVKVRTARGEIRDVITTVALVESEGRSSLVSQIYDITKRKRDEDRLRLCTRIAQVGYESTSFNDVLFRSLSAIQEAFGAVRVGYSAIEDGIMRTLGAVAPTGLPAIELEAIDIGTISDYLAVLDDGTPIIISEFNDDSPFPGLIAQLSPYGVRSIIDVPVRRGDHLVGVLFLDSFSPVHWSDSLVETLTEVAALFSVSLFRARAEEDLRRERELMQIVMDHAPDFLYLKDSKLRFTRMSKAMATSHGFGDADEAIGLTDFDLFPAELAKVFQADDRRVLATGEPIINALEPRDVAHSGWSLTSKVPIKDQAGRPIGLVGTGRDVTDRQVMEAELRASETRQRAILDAIPDVMIRLNREGVYLDVRASRQGALWVDPAERIGRKIGESNRSRASEIMLEAVQRCLKCSSVVTTEYEMEHEGRIHIFEMRLAPCETDEIVGISRDITERKMLEQRLEYQAMHDPLTGLPNRSLILARLSDALAPDRGPSQSAGIVFIDLDDFKLINDGRGHSTGDRLLIAIAERLRLCVDAGVIVGRIAGDEFAVLHGGPTNDRELRAIAARILDYLALPIRLGEQTVRVSASVGFAVGTAGRDSAEAVLSNADHAMYHVKRQQKRARLSDRAASA